MKSYLFKYKHKDIKRYETVLVNAKSEKKAHEKLKNMLAFKKDVIITYHTLC